MIYYGVAGKPANTIIGGFKDEENHKRILALCLIVAIAAQIAPTGHWLKMPRMMNPLQENPRLVSNYEELVEAILDAEGDTIIAQVNEIAPHTTFNDGKTLLCGG